MTPPASLPTIVAATDGSCLGNPGPGGWAYATQRRVVSGPIAHTTNNAMELRAVRELLADTAAAGLGHLPLQVFADSKYVIGIFQGFPDEAKRPYLPGWARNGFRTAAKEPVKNRELVEEIAALLDGRVVSFVWVKGHMGHELNEKADLACRTAAESQLPAPYVPD